MSVSEQCSAFKIRFRRNHAAQQFLLHPYLTAPWSSHPQPKQRLLFFGACFAVAKTFMQYVGKERMESLAILLPVLWIGTRLMPRDQKIERRSKEDRKKDADAPTAH